MTTILLIRHGQNEYVKKGKLAGRKEGVHLNDKGQAQAQIVAEYLKNVKLKAVYASPLDRTVETAQPIADAQKLAMTIKEGLLEVDFGDWQDKSLKQLANRKLWRVVQGNPARMRFPNGESFAEAQLRIVNQLEALASEHKSKDIVACVGHSDMIKLAAAYYLGVPLDLFQRIMVQPASITTLHLGEFGAQLINLNVVPPGV